MLQHLAKDVSHPLALAEIREHELRHLDGEQIEWIVGENCAPVLDGPTHVAARPGVERVDVSRLAQRRTLEECRVARTEERSTRLLRALALARQHAQVPIEAMRECAV